jgi:adenylate cyclase
MSFPRFVIQLYRHSVDQYFFSGHFLVKEIYLPRVCAYLIATLITYWGIKPEGLNSSQIVFLVFLLLYPHLQFLVVSLRFNHEGGARASMIFDGLMVGVLIVANHFHFIASISFLASLTMSTLIIARYPIVLANIAGALVVCCLGYGLDIDSGLISQSDGKETAAAALVLIYSALVAGLGYRTTMLLGEKRKQLSITSNEMTTISEKLRRYVSPQIYSRIANRVHEQSARKCLTVFFSDIEGFTELMDRLEEETVTRILNEYLNSMAEIAIERGGTIDKFMGDGIMVFFGDPATEGQHKDALACIKMALAMREKVKLLRLKWSEEGIFSDLHVRIGIHTGFCTVGNFGCESRMDYTAVGSTVNLASRLEGKAMQDGILISGDTYKLVHREVRVHHRDPVYLKGIKRGIETHDVLGFDRKNEQEIGRQAAGFTLSLDPTLMNSAEVKAMLHETIATIEAIETRRLEKTVVLQILNRTT